jgi:hypothetical protein
MKLITGENTNPWNQCLGTNATYNVEDILNWNMSITPLQKKFSGQCIIELPVKAYIANENYKTTIIKIN